MHFGVFEKISSAYLHQIAQAIMLLLNNNLHKQITESQDGHNFWQRIFVICTCVTTLQSCYMKNVIVFTQSQMCTLFSWLVLILKSLFFGMQVCWLPVKFKSLKVECILHIVKDYFNNVYHIFQWACMLCLVYLAAYTRLKLVCKKLVCAILCYRYSVYVC